MRELEIDREYPTPCRIKQITSSGDQQPQKTSHIRERLLRSK
jgi:hypothetical protein